MGIFHSGPSGSLDAHAFARKLNRPEPSHDKRARLRGKTNRPEPSHDKRARLRGKTNRPEQSHTDRPDSGQDRQNLVIAMSGRVLDTVDFKRYRRAPLAAVLKQEPIATVCSSIALS